MADYPTDIEIWGEAIRVDGAVVAEFRADAPAWLRDRLENALKDLSPDDVDHLEEQIVDLKNQIEELEDSVRNSDEDREKAEEHAERTAEDLGHLRKAVEDSAKALRAALEGGPMILTADASHIARGLEKAAERSKAEESTPA